MKSTHKKTIIIVSVLIVIAIASFFIVRKQIRKKRLAGSYDGVGEQPTTTAATTVSNFFYPLPDSPFSTSKDIKDFQTWVMNVKKDSAILGKYLNDGEWGRNTSKAFDKYGAEYMASLKPAPGENSPTGASSNNMKSTYDQSWYISQANKLFDLWNGVTSQANTYAAMNILLSLKTDTDWYKLYTAFGTRNGWDLRKWIDWESTTAMIKQINATWKKNGMTRQLAENPSALTSFLENI